MFVLPNPFISGTSTWTSLDYTGCSYVLIIINHWRIPIREGKRFFCFSRLIWPTFFGRKNVSRKIYDRGGFTQCFTQWWPIVDLTTFFSAYWTGFLSQVCRCFRLFFAGRFVGKKPNNMVLSCSFYISVRHSNPYPIGSMGLVYLPTFTIRINHSCIGIYTIPMDPAGTVDSGV